MNDVRAKAAPFLPNIIHEAHRIPFRVVKKKRRESDRAYASNREITARRNIMRKFNYTELLILPILIWALVSGCDSAKANNAPTGQPSSGNTISGATGTTMEDLLKEGQQTFRFDTFGDEKLWGDTLKLHRAIEGSNFGGVGAGVSPKTALDVGLKVDVDALPADLVAALKAGKVDLNDPATTLALLKLNAVVGVTGFFNNDGSLRSMGIQCAFCHSTVDDSFAPGIGHRLDGWANVDLNVGAIIALAPDLTAIVDQLKLVNASIDDGTVRTVLNSWGPGKFDAQLLLDGKALRPDGKPGATLIPNAYGMAGYNMHTWTADWGSVPYWNALVAVLEMGGIGNFHDPRLDDPEQFPDIAPGSRLPLRSRRGMCRLMREATASPQSCRAFTFTSSRFWLRSPGRARISMLRQRDAATSCSAVKLSAERVIWSRSGQSRDGMRISLTISGSTVSSPTGRPGKRIRR